MGFIDLNLVNWKEIGFRIIGYLIRLSLKLAIYYCLY